MSAQSGDYAINTPHFSKEVEIFGIDERGKFERGMPIGGRIGSIGRRIYVSNLLIGGFPSSFGGASDGRGKCVGIGFCPIIGWRVTLLVRIKKI